DTIEMIKQAEESGIHSFIRTLTPLATCISYVSDLEMSSYVITSNGPEIYTTDEELIEQHIMHTEKMEKLWHIGNNRGLTMWMLASDAVFVQGRRPSDFSEHDWLKIGYDHLDEEDR